MDVQADSLAGEQGMVPSRQVVDALVGIDEAAVPVDDQNRIGVVIEQSLNELLLFLEAALDLATLRHVAEKTVNAHEPAGFVADGVSASGTPYALAVLPDVYNFAIRQETVLVDSAYDLLAIAGIRVKVAEVVLKEFFFVVIS